VTDRLTGQYAFVTGAGRGLGRAIAVGLASEGASLIICSRTSSELEKTAEQIHSIGGQVTSISVNLADHRACQELIADIQQQTQQIDVLINNAGVLRLTPFEELTFQEWSVTLDVNLNAPFHLIRSLLPNMKARGGAIINVSSRAGVLGFKDEAAYCTSKFGMEGLTRALAVELAGSPVSINTVTPGLKIKPTSMTEEAFENLSDEERKAWSNPDEIVPAFVYLAMQRGEVSGYRFDARVLTEAIRGEGFDMDPARAKELAENNT
jgi:NAD(P)-dependent dehydrogenase (short-subunit alcohol dehydrogenase family)